MNSKPYEWIAILVQDDPNKPKYLVTFTVGYGQKDNIDAAVKKVSFPLLVVFFMSR